MYEACFDNIVHSLVNVMSISIGASVGETLSFSSKINKNVIIGILFILEDRLKLHYASNL